MDDDDDCSCDATGLEDVPPWTLTLLALAGLGLMRRRSR
jgi:MYXO-CTERM domain-containing protein